MQQGILTDKYLQTSAADVFAAGDAANRVRVMVGSRQILGAIVMGDQTLSRPLHHLIANRVDISPIHAQLLSPDAPLDNLLMNFWLNWRKRDAPTQL